MTPIYLERFKRETKGCVSVHSWSLTAQIYLYDPFVYMFCLDFYNDNERF